MCVALLKTRRVCNLGMWMHAYKAKKKFNRPHLNLYTVMWLIGIQKNIKITPQYP